MNFEKEIEGYKQIANITAYINDDTFVCIKYFSSKTNKDKGLSYGLLVNYPFNLFEDEKEILIELSNLLENSGYEVEQIKDFSLAKQEILNSKADLVLLDINIPVINGELLLNEIRKESNVPIIMLTSRVNDDDFVH